MLRFWLTVAFLATAVQSIDYNVFRNCSREAFCAKFRNQVLDENAQFLADVTQVSRFLNVVNVPLTNSNGETLTLAISILAGHKLRIKVLEPNHRRYEIIDVLTDNIEEYPPSVNESTDAVTITSSWAEEDKIVVKKGPPFIVEFYHEDQLEIVLNGDRLVMENTDSSQAFSFALEFEDASKLYGFAHHSYKLALGETTDGLSDPFRLKNTDNWGYDADSTTALYGSIPAIYGHSPNRTSGAFVHNAAQMFVDISYSGDRPFAYFMVESGSFDLFILLGPTPKEVVRQYTSLTGVTSLPQIWALGYHQNRYTYWTQEEVKEVVAKLDAADFPLDVIFLDDGYTNGNRYFKWNPENFTDPLEMQQNVSATGRHMIAVSDPHVAVDENYFMYVSGKELDLYVKNQDGSDFQDVSWPGTSVWVDFLNPAARDWYANLFLYEHFSGTTSTIGGFWNDMNEPSIFNDTSERTFPPEAVHYGQVTNREIHNMYGLLHVKATSTGLAVRDNYEKRGFILSRSHFAGSQRYAAVWTGDNISDWPHLRNSISECLTFNLLGTVMCGADVGGFFTDPTDELFQRWYQAAIWIPYFRAHSNKGTVRREPYLFPEEIQAVLRLAVKTRYKHIPYWYLLMFEHTQSGDPLIRPLFYSYPEYLEYDDHLLLGEDILARPVLESEVSEVQVTFPGSDLWYRVDDDSWTIYEGGTQQNVAVNITTSPYFYRSGSIIARKDIERPSTTQMADDPFQLYVTLDANNNAEGRLYFDDYVSFEFSTKKAYFYFRLTYDFESNGVKFANITGNSEGFNARIQKIVVHQLGEHNETMTATYTTTKDGISLEDIDIVQKYQLMRNDNGFTLYLFWLATATLITVAQTADDVFHTCEMESFCKTFRSQVLDENSQFTANVAEAKIVLNTVNVPLTNGNGDSLTLELSILFGQKMRIKVLDDAQLRYIIKNVLPVDKKDYPPAINASTDLVTITSTWAVDDKIIVRKGPPFTVECYHQNQLEIVLNGDRLVMKNATTIEDQAFSFTVEFEKAEKLYGLAHHSYKLALGETADGSSEPFRLKNMDNSGYEADSTMALSSSIPVVYGNSANFTSGVFLHNAAQMFVDISYTADRPSAYFMVECGQFDLILFLGPKPRDVVRQYISMTGVTRMPQLWVFGYHQNRFTYWTQEEVKEVVAKMDQADFPLDVIYLDKGYTNSSRYFEWNPENFTDPLDLQQNISATGRRIIAVLNPHTALDLDYSVYVSGKQLDYYIKNPNGSDFKDISRPGESVWIDFLNSETRLWYANLFYYQNFDGSTETIAGICHDMNEPSVSNDATERTVPPDVLHYDQVYDREIHNMYGLLHVMATNTGMSVRDLYTTRVFILSRSHFAKSQSYAAVWTGDNTGDWPYLRNSISECLTFNLLGAVQCGANVGGFYGNPSEELLQRWYQAAIWIPYFRAHSATPREPYLYSDDVQAVIRLAIKTRYKHIPYWYRLMFDHTESGDPLIRPLFYSYPEYLEYDDHLLIGEDILSRPVVESDVTEVEVSFPGDGIWYRVDDDSWMIYEGSTQQNLEVNITTSPYFYRGGSIIPRMDIERPSTTQMMTDPFQLYVNLDADENAEGRLYFDDYTTLEYTTRISYFYFRLVYDSGTNGIWFERIVGNPDGFNVRIQRIIVHQPGRDTGTITTSYTTTKDGTPLQDIDIVQQYQLLKQSSFVIYL